MFGVLLGGAVYVLEVICDAFVDEFEEEMDLLLLGTYFVELELVIFLGLLIKGVSDRKRGWISLERMARPTKTVFF